MRIRQELHRKTSIVKLVAVSVHHSQSRFRGVDRVGPHLDYERRLDLFLRFGRKQSTHPLDRLFVWNYLLVDTTIDHDAWPCWISGQFLRVSTGLHWMRRRFCRAGQCVAGFSPATHRFKESGAISWSLATRWKNTNNTCGWRCHVRPTISNDSRVFPAAPTEPPRGAQASRVRLVAQTWLGTTHRIADGFQHEALVGRAGADVARGERLALGHEAVEGGARQPLRRVQTAPRAADFGQTVRDAQLLGRHVSCYSRARAPVRPRRRPGSEWGRTRVNKLTLAPWRNGSRPSPRPVSDQSASAPDPPPPSGSAAEPPNRFQSAPVSGCWTCWPISRTEQPQQRQRSTGRTVTETGSTDPVGERWTRWFRSAGRRRLPSPSNPIPPRCWTRSGYVKHWRWWRFYRIGAYCAVFSVHSRGAKGEIISRRPAVVVFWNTRLPEIAIV